MRKADECALHAILRPLGKSVTRQAVMDACEEIGMHPNRAAYVMQKWTSRTIGYDYGVNVFCGWFCDDALEVLPP